MAGRILFVFIDGFGLASAAASNPLSAETMPALTALLGTEPLAGLSVERPGLLARGIDARLGVEGLPQSATGQTSLFAGVNAAAALGSHLPAYPNRHLAGLLRQDNILKRVHEAGLRATFANAYSEHYFAELAADERTPSATTLAVQGAGIPFRLLDDLLAGRAVYWDITRARLAARTGRDGIPLVDAATAAGHLAGLARDHELVLYETFLTDMLGHKCDHVACAAFLGILDTFLGRLADEVAGDGGTLVITSDHGNIEDLATRAHTLNQVPLIAVGPAAAAFRDVASIAGVADAIIRAIDG